jgi:hypothetical protein
MIGLTDEQYASIGRIAVESGTLEREVEEYLTRLRASFNGKLPLMGKLKALRREVSSNAHTSRAAPSFEWALDRIEALICERNAVIHGVWSVASNAPLLLEAKGRKATVRAPQALAVADRLRLSRKLLLKLFCEQYPPGAGSKRCPKASASHLQRKLTPPKPLSHAA